MNIPMHAKSASAPNSAVGAARNRSTIQESAPAKGATKKPAEAKAPMGRSGSAGWSDLPSSRLKSVKCADPFATKANQFKTKFGSVYNGGGIPCRLNHGAVNIKLQWSTDPMELDYDPLLVTCAEGLCETEHPYAFASRACFGELLAADCGPDKAVPLVPRIVPSIRAALVSPNKKVFEGGVEAAQQLSQVAAPPSNCFRCEQLVLNQGIEVMFEDCKCVVCSDTDAGGGDGKQKGDNELWDSSQLSHSSLELTMDLWTAGGW